MADTKFEVTRAALTTAAATNTQDITISGFGTPKAAIFIVTSAITDATVAADAMFSIGWTDGTRESAACYLSDDDGVNTYAQNAHYNNRVISFHGPGSQTETTGFGFDSWITDGVRIVVDEQADAAYLCTVILIGGSDVSNVYVGNYDDLGTSNQTIDITDPGFEPDVVFMAHTQETSWGTPANQAYFSVGCCINDGADTQRCIAKYLDHNQSTSSHYGLIENTAASALIHSSATFFDSTIGTFDSSGFSVTVSASAFSTVMSYLAIKFSNSPNIDLFDTSWPTSGSVNEETPAFEPSFAMIFDLAGISTRNTRTNADASFGITAFDSNGAYSISSTHDDDGLTNEKSLSNDSIGLLGSDGSTTEVAASGYAFDSLGYNVTLTTNPASARLGWAFVIDSDTGTDLTQNSTPNIALAGLSGTVDRTITGNATPDILFAALAGTVSYVPSSGVPDSIAVVNGALPTSGTVDLTSSGFGTPEGVVLIVSGALLDATITNDAVLAIGAMDDTTEGSISFTAEDAISPSRTNRTLYSSLSSAAIANTSTTLDWDITGTLITDGVRLSITNAPAGANLCTALLLGNNGIATVEVIIQDDLGAASGDVAVSLSKFGSGAPDLVLGFTNNGATAAPFAASNGVMSMGISDFTNHGSISFGGPDSTTGEYMSAAVHNDMMLTQTFNGTIAWEGYPHTPTTTNFQFNMSASGGNDIAIFVAIGLNSGYGASIDNVSVPTGADLTVSTSVTPDSNLILTCEGPTTEGTVIATADVVPGITAYDGYNISAISLSVTDTTDQAAKSQHSDSLDLLNGAGSGSSVVGIPSFDGQDVDWATSTRPSSAILGTSLTIGAAADPIAVVTGTAVNVPWETIRDSGGTIIVTLTNDTFIAAGTGPIGTTAQSDTFVQSFVAATSPTNGWNNEISLDNTDLVRTSDTVATITVPATGTYDPLATELVTGEVQAAILTNFGSNVTAGPFSITVQGDGRSFISDTVQSMVQDMVQDMVN